MPVKSRPLKDRANQPSKQVRARTPVKSRTPVKDGARHDTRQPARNRHFGSRKIRLRQLGRSETASVTISSGSMNKNACPGSITSARIDAAARARRTQILPLTPLQKPPLARRQQKMSNPEPA
jgi:hypothetical protein